MLAAFARGETPADAFLEAYVPQRARAHRLEAKLAAAAAVL